MPGRWFNHQSESSSAPLPPLCFAMPLISGGALQKDSGFSPKAQKNYLLYAYLQEFTDPASLTLKFPFSHGRLRK